MMVVMSLTKSNFDLFSTFSVHLLKLFSFGSRRYFQISIIKRNFWLGLHWMFDLEKYIPLLSQLLSLFVVLSNLSDIILFLSESSSDQLSDSVTLSATFPQSLLSDSWMSIWRSSFIHLINSNVFFHNYERTNVARERRLL